ncbi:MAG: lipid-binding SYLF domain-containing protein [Proteobacteria bacterium]|nr:lipid-binding SYLF domain-containing protein [Pseudomonadota bacterium]
MKAILRPVALLVALLFPISAAWADSYSDAIGVFKGAGESSEFFKHAYAYAVFPSIGKGGIGVGAAHGTGRVYVGGKPVGESKMTQLSVGLQLGGQVFSQIIFFEDKRSFDEFTGGNFEFGAEASAVAITAGASAGTSTSGNTASASGGQHDATTAGAYHKGMAIFTIAKGGLMYAATLGGQKYSYKPL